MQIQFMFPANPMNPQRIDEHFLPQAEALSLMYCYPALYSLENQKVSSIQIPRLNCFRH